MLYLSSHIYKKVEMSIIFDASTFYFALFLISVDNYVDVDNMFLLGNLRKKSKILNTNVIAMMVRINIKIIVHTFM